MAALLRRRGERVASARGRGPGQASCSCSPGRAGPSVRGEWPPPPPAQAPRIRMTDKPFAPACERNRDPILAVLREHFAGSRHVLEVGSGTGQHAVHFAAAMPLLRWQCSDQAEHLPCIRAWLDAAALDNTPLPLARDVSERSEEHTY